MLNPGVEALDLSPEVPDPDVPKTLSEALPNPAVPVPVEPNPGAVPKPAVLEEVLGLKPVLFVLVPKPGLPVVAPAPKT